MDWNCTLTEERLSDYLEGVLSASESDAFEAHRQGCARCGELVAQVGGLLSRMHSLELVEAPVQLQAKIIDATLGPRPSKQGWRRWFAWTPAIWQPRFAIGLATVAASAVIIVQAGGVLPTKMHKADLNPADVVRSMNRQAHLTYARGVKFVNDLRVVYEIESRLQPQNPPQENPAQPQQNNFQKNPNNPNNRQEKSDKRPGRSQAQSDVYYAQASPAAATVSFDATHPRRRFATHQDRCLTRGGARDARAASGDPNRDHGFLASAVPPATARGVAADGSVKPEWSAP
jgi:anti-sigma factor RsiW